MQIDWVCVRERELLLAIERERERERDYVRMIDRDANRLYEGVSEKWVNDCCAKSLPR